MKNDYFFYLYRLQCNEISSIDVDKFKSILKEYDIEVFSPSIFNLREHSSKIFIYLFWYLFTWGKYKILYVKKNGLIVHYTHMLPGFFKFPFMVSGDIEIGPAWTKEEYRGKRIFPAVISYLVQNFKKKNRNFYILIRVNNISSQRSISHTDFLKWGSGVKTNIAGIYKVNNYYE